MEICISRMLKRKLSYLRRTLSLRIRRVVYLSRIIASSNSKRSDIDRKSVCDMWGHCWKYPSIFVGLYLFQLWPIAKTGFSPPIMDVSYPGCHITCFTEYSASLLYACTSRGDVIEINYRNSHSEVIVTIENEVV